MRTRVISGVVLGLLLAITIISGGFITGGVLLFVSLVAYHELARVLSFSKIEGKTSLVEVFGFLMIVLHYALMIASKGNMLYFVLLFMLTFIGEAAIFVFSFPKYKSAQLISAIFSFVYAPVMLSFIYLIRIREYGVYLAWLPFIAWICDTCAYFAGSAFGKHKLCPLLSPKKTIEGAVGGCLGSVVAGIVYGFIYATYSGADIAVTRSVITFAVITLFASALSQVGDLIASGLKRDNNIKDYGNIIPGHGGILDRFDSVIFITPIIYFMIIGLM